MTSKWEELERWVERQQLPKGFEILREPDWVEQYVRRMMTKALPEAAGLISGSAKISFSETKKYLHVKIKLPDGSIPEQIKVMVREDQLRIDGLPNGKEETIRLPKLVRIRTCQAMIKGTTLFLRLQKRPPLRSYYEPTVRLRP